MKKAYLKMNDNDEHLSLGNLFRLVKDLSKNKSSAMQSELFCTLFEVDCINDTTVNNYCVGCRGIGGEYKQIYLNKNNKYKKNHEEFADNIIGLLSIMDGNVYIVNDNKIDFINKNISCEYLTNKLYNIAKNDKEVSNTTVNIVRDYIKNGSIYEALVELLLFIILFKKQPQYIEELKKEVLDNILSDTSISSTSLQEYLSLKLREGINYDYSLKELANNGNAYANFEMGTNEYYGYYMGYPRYDCALNYLVKAANMNHAGANYMIGNMYVKGLIGGKSKDELKKGYEYLLKSYNLGNVAASNMIGNMYKNGIYPLKVDYDKALEYYNKACDSNYVYAYNNIGMIYEEKNDTNKAFENFKIAASLGESWACNKVAEYLRLGIVKKDMKEAFNYYNKALDSNYRILCYYAYYNLAKYYYMCGYDDVVPVKDVNKAINYFEIAANNGCYDALKELFYIYVDKYIKDKNRNDYDLLMKYKVLLENNSKYNDSIKKEIENKIINIKNNNEIDLSVVI